MKLLLHACCADCVLKYLESVQAIKSRLDDRDTSLVTTIYYYNPNIHPRAEYLARLAAIRKMVGEKAKIIVPDWRPREYFEKINLPKSLFNKRDLNKTERCIKCWELRLEATAKFAAENGYEAFSSTLVTSEYQDQDTIQKIAEAKAKKYKIKFWKPEHVCTCLKTAGFYKQFFCGCVYSMRERYEEKYRNEKLDSRN